MPVPKPNPSENEKIFISRCMESLKNDTNPQNVKLGICYSQLRKAKTKKKSKGSNEPPTWEESNDHGGAFVIF